MNNFIFTVEAEAFEGVKRIAKKVAADFEKVCGNLPEILQTLPKENQENSVIFATLGKSPIADAFIKSGKIDPSFVAGKREVYQIKYIGKTLLILGSDKRGTIYGMFALSEFIGVSPLHFWGDAEPSRRKNIEITDRIETISKEPSVKYRGFFINDEWPCYGNWTFKHYEGFTSDMYDHVFELLLRLKGNYLWPAMWTSCFPLDGPGDANEELADIYGVVMGASHHEPCLRASEEWDKVRGHESIYGDDWNYYKNKDGLLKYWEDALIRSGKYEKIITIGMRGERDSSMLGDNSSLKENIDLLKDIIKNQRELIKKHVNPDINSVPQVLALYKEVEEYFYGGENAEGLKEWSELDGVTCMLCEDNFGFMRTLPTEEIRNRKGGFGMYYHFDYHGGPVSYEWMPSTSFERTWEQMSMAYDYGIKDIWIVNVGDLKFNETLLAYFMELAYDFKKWGTSAPNSIDSYTSMWLEKTFPNTTARIREKMAKVFHGYIRMNAARRPEALNDGIYHPCHYFETDRMLALADNIEALNKDVCEYLESSSFVEEGPDVSLEGERDAYYSMISFPAKASINLLRMHLYAGKNRHYANQGKKTANDFASLVTECIEKDHALMKEFSYFKNGKWEGMELEQHIGFVKWNEDNCRYPLRLKVEPAYKPRMVVSRKDREEIYTKTYGRPMTIYIDDFMYADNDEVVLEIANDGIGHLDYEIRQERLNNWLELSSTRGRVESSEEIILRCNRKNFKSEIQSAKLKIMDNETAVAVEIRAKAVDTNSLPPMTFLENNGVIVINANHFCGKKDVNGCGFVELKNYGKSGCAVKAFPVTTDFSKCSADSRPNITYRFLIEEANDYYVEVWTTPTNPVQNKSSLRFTLSDSNGKSQEITAVCADFRAGSPSDSKWCQGVLDNIRVNSASFTFEKGVQEISVGIMEAGLVLERILIYKKNPADKNAAKPLVSYLGPPESFYVK